MNSIEVCGYCHRGSNPVKGRLQGRYALLARVVVTSRGQSYFSLSHVHCLYKWNRVSEVRLSGDSPEVQEAKERLQQYRLKKSQWHKGLIERKGNQCPVCHCPIQPQSKHCIYHAQQVRRRKQLQVQSGDLVV